MERMKSWFCDYFLYAGLTKQEYGEIRGAIYRKNRESLRGASLVTGFLLTGLFLLSFVSPTIAKSHMLYGCTAIPVWCLYLISRRGQAQEEFCDVTASRRERWMTAASYGLLIIAFGFAIALGAVIQNQIPATTFCVLLFAAPLLFTEPPYRMSLLLLAVTVVFCATSFRNKAFEVANLDEVNAVSFLFLGIMVNAMVTRVKMRDLSQRRHIEREKNTDDLTRLKTKAAVNQEIHAYMKRTKATAALLIIDIDNFKGINDRYGHAYGDAVLRLMGNCIREAFRENDILGRFGGDEFVIFLPYTEETVEVVRYVKRLEELLKKHLVVPETATPVGVSIGIAFYPNDGEDYERLFQRADEALYRSKGQGKNQYTFYFDVDPKK